MLTIWMMVAVPRMGMESGSAIARYLTAVSAPSISAASKISAGSPRKKVTNKNTLIRLPLV